MTSEQTIHFGNIGTINRKLKSMSDNGGGKLTFGAGTFPLNNTMYWPSNVTIEGQGINQTILEWVDGSYHRVENLDTVNGNSFIRVSGMTMKFGGAAGSADFHGIRLKNVTDFWMDNVEMQNAPHHNFVSIDGTLNARWYIRDCVSSGAGQRTGTDGDGFRPADGFATAQPENGAMLTGCRAVNNSHHGYHLGPGCVATGCYGSGNGTANGYINGLGAKLIGGVWANPTGHNLLSDSALNGLIADNYVEGSGTTSTDAIRIQCTGSDGVIIRGNHVVCSKRAGIRICSDNVIVTGNVIDGGSNGIYGIWLVDVDRTQIIGNAIFDADQSPGRGIFLDRVSGTIDRTSIVGNSIYSNATGLFVENHACVTNVWASGNVFDSNSATAINDAGCKVTVGADFSVTSKYSLTCHSHC